ncbi:transcriptional protein SWT1-like [Physella acuta]|uniref:transcriptional protein SWT1-like n=1 Tax=Physella acuta TaxID=109671 RepID=UPI0027DAF925|nr:transcriptional protein SWT1-like [Physella acuta]
MSFSNGEDKSLPPNWDIKHSKTRGGRVYYYNRVTGESVWKLPKATSDKVLSNVLTPTDAQGRNENTEIQDQTFHKRKQPFSPENMLLEKKSKPENVSVVKRSASRIPIPIKKHKSLSKGKQKTEGATTLREAIKPEELSSVRERDKSEGLSSAVGKNKFKSSTLLKKTNKSESFKDRFEGSASLRETNRSEGLPSVREKSRSDDSVLSNNSNKFKSSIPSRETIKTEISCLAKETKKPEGSASAWETYQSERSSSQTKQKLKSSAEINNSLTCSPSRTNSTFLNKSVQNCDGTLAEKSFINSFSPVIKADQDQIFDITRKDLVDGRKPELEVQSQVAIESPAGTLTTTRPIAKARKRKKENSMGEAPTNLGNTVDPDHAAQSANTVIAIPSPAEMNTNFNVIPSEKGDDANRQKETVDILNGTVDQVSQRNVAKLSFSGTNKSRRDGITHSNQMKSQKSHLTSSLLLGTNSLQQNQCYSENNFNLNTAIRKNIPADNRPISPTSKDFSPGLSLTPGSRGGSNDVKTSSNVDLINAGSNENILSFENLQSSHYSPFSGYDQNCNHNIDVGAIPNSGITIDVIQPAANDGNDRLEEVEDMEVDEDDELHLSNLQDVRKQALPISHQPCDVFIDTVPNTDNSKNAQKFVLIIDTNILISCLTIVQNILFMDIPVFGPPLLVLPWVVVQELDYLKNGNKSRTASMKETANKAAKAIRFINGKLSERHNGLVGQTPQEANESADFPIECNDDRILQCCIQCNKKYIKSLVTLLTRDINLINKATIMGINAANTETLWKLHNLPKPRFIINQNLLQPPGRQSKTEAEKNMPVKQPTKVTLTDGNENRQTPNLSSATTSLPDPTPHKNATCMPTQIVCVNVNTIDMSDLANKNLCKC